MSAEQGRLPSGVPFEIRPVERADASGLLTLEQALAEEGEGTVRDPSELPGDEASMLRELDPFLDPAPSRAPGRRLVARALEAGTVPVLAAGELLRLGPARVRHVGLLSVGVHASVRRQGLGRLLVEALASWSFASGLLRVELHVRADNAAALGLYAACGFELEGRKRGFVREADGMLVDGLMMARLAPGASQLKRE